MHGRTTASGTAARRRAASLRPTFSAKSARKNTPIIVSFPQPYLSNKTL